jgi:hypothetical protein
MVDGAVVRSGAEGGVVPSRRQYYRRAMRDREYFRDDDETASRLAPKGGDGRFDFCVAANGRTDWHDLE